MRWIKCSCGKSDGNDDQIIRQQLKFVSYNGGECIITELRQCDICGQKRLVDLHYKFTYEELISLGCISEFESQVISECRELGMDDSEIQKWLQET